MASEGIDRRFQSHGEVETANGRVMLVDDYGHHPTEVAATLSAARAGWPERRIVFGLPTASIHENTGFTGRLCERAVRSRCAGPAGGLRSGRGSDHRRGWSGNGAERFVAAGGVEPVFVESLNELVPVLQGLLVDGDLVLTMGAGDIGAFSATLPDLLRSKPSLEVLS